MVMVSNVKHLLRHIDMSVLCHKIRTITDITIGPVHSTIMELASFVFSIKTGISPALWSVLRARATLTHANDLLVIWAIVHEYLSRIFILSGGCQRMPLV